VRADPTAPAADEPPSSAARPSPAWVTLAEPGTRTDLDQPVRVRRVLIQLAVAAIAVIAVVGVAGSLVSRRTAENQAVHDAAQMADLVADSVVQPAITEAMATDPAAARAGLDELVRTRVLSASLVRVKLWTPAGRIVYSDESRLVGTTFGLDDGAREVFTDPQTRAEISDVSRPENEFEQGYGKLLEVYRPVWTPSGQPLLFETYYRYDAVSERASQLWRGFSGIMLSSLAAIFVLLVPLVWTLLARTRRAQRQREDTMRRAVDASQDERRRIAATLHDGLVQELAAASFVVAGSAEAAAARGDLELAHTLREAAGSVRSGLSGARALLVDIYPPSLSAAGLAATLRDLALPAGGRAPVVVDLDDDVASAADALAPERQQAVFRVAQEALRNATRHASASRVAMTVQADEDEVVLTITADGAGFDPHATGLEDHFGLRLMADAARSVDGTLSVASAPGSGTSWELAVPR
jgi:two-component system NarL family sensor kinase